MTTPYAIKSAFQAERLLYAELAKDRETRSDLRELAVAAEEAAIAEHGKADTWEDLGAKINAGTQIAKTGFELAGREDVADEIDDGVAQTLIAGAKAGHEQQSGALQGSADSLNRAVETAREHSQNLLSV